MQCSGSGSCSCNFSIYLSVNLQDWKRSNSARLPQVLNLTTSKRSNSTRLSQFSKLATSKTKLFCETSSFFEVDTSKRGNSARIPSKMESWVQSWRPRTNAICDFSTPSVWSAACATKKWCQVIRSAAPVTQNHLGKAENLMLQNETLLRKSAPWPPNISLVLRLPREMHFCRSSSKVPRLPTLLKMLQTFTFCSLLTRWRIPWAYHAKRHLNAINCPEHRNVLRATTACTFSTCQLPEVVRHWNALYILTWKCASFHTTVCTFSTYQLLKVLREWCALYILTSKFASRHACNFSSLIWPDGSAPAALASLLFDPPEPQIIGKTQWNATFLPFRAPASSFFWLFLFSELLSSSLLFSGSSLAPLLFHLSIFSDVWLLNFLRL